ncbi:hypothetical protein [Kosakonia oryzae]|uniref:hypothetical protein n=1 Tax=Kosakonia oryzae TaxID=497725 RepID=UPI001D06B732|nr:hypothetical protein [Kosakonia oryzae]UDJ80217.1 hypothetical protein I5186_13345 [Kosakonia oryzae]
MPGELFPGIVYSPGSLNVRAASGTGRALFFVLAERVVCQHKAGLKRRVYPSPLFKQTAV